MKKRMTLLAKREGMSTSDFRSYWSGPHAKLALGMDGIERYTQNRVDKVLWCRGDHPAFNADGIVELCFASEQAMHRAQGSRLGNHHIPGDEPNFLHGWTLCIVESDARVVHAAEPQAKVIVPFAGTAEGGRNRLATAVAQVAERTGLGFSLDWTVGTASRQRLWSEPTPPMGFVTLHFSSVANAHDAFDEGSQLRTVLAGELVEPTAYLVDGLQIRG